MSKPKSKTKPKSETLSDVTRSALEGSRMSVFAIAEQTGIHRGTLSRFINRKASLTLDTFDRLNEVLRLRITRR